MNKITDIFIEHCVDGDLWPLVESYISQYGKVFTIDMFLDSIYDDITWDIAYGAETRLKPLLIQLIDLAFDEIDEKELDAAVIEKFKEQKESDK